MIENWWAVIDPELDRPFFSSSPPPDTLKRKPGLQVIRFEVKVAEPAAVDHVLPAASIEDMRSCAQRTFNTLKSFF